MKRLSCFFGMRSPKEEGNEGEQHFAGAIRRAAYEQW